MQVTRSLYADVAIACKFSLQYLDVSVYSGNIAAPCLEKELTEADDGW